MTSAHAKPVSQATFIAAAMNPELPAPEGLIGPDGQACPKRFSVYRNNIIVSLKEGMASGFPAVAALVGPEFFSAMMDVYVRQTPPKSPIFALYGDNFSDFIASFGPAHSLPYLADVAALEYAKRCSYHAADAAPVSNEDLQDPRLFTASLTLAPAVQVLSSAYPVTQIHDAAFGGPAPTGTAEDVIVTRPDLDPIATGFPTGTCRVIEAMRAKNTLSEAIELAPQELDLSTFITALFTGGAITKLEFHNV